MKDPIRPDKSGLPKAGVISLLLHIALITFLSFNLRLTIPKSELSVYRVTLRPFSSPGSEIPQGGSSPNLPGPSQELPTAPATEKTKSEDSRKEKENTPIVKPNQKKTEKKEEKPAKAEISLAPKKQKTPDTKKGEAVAKEEEAEKALQETIDEMRLKKTIEDMQKRVDSREGSAAGPAGNTLAKGGSAGEGPGGLPGGGGSLRLSPEEVYKNIVFARIMKEWVLPENFAKKEKNLETIIIIIIGWNDGKVKKTSFEKKSGNDLYDQMAMRAIKKAEPFPPIPKECMENTFGIIFRPDQLAK